MMPDVVDVLADECERVTRLLFELTPEEFAKPTRCEPWDVKDLAAHLYRNMFRIPAALDRDPDGEPDTDGVTYWTSYDPAADSPAIAQHAHETAASYDSGRDLAVAFEDLWRTALERARGEDPARVVQSWWGPRLRLDEFLKTRVLENVVHGLDLTDAVEGPPIASNAGMEMVTGILEGILGGPPPSRWTSLEFIEKGTGRSSLTDEDTRELGPNAARFPLLS